MHESSSSLGAEEADVQLHWGVKISLRDQVHLNATVYLPRELRAPRPVIFTLTPYIAQTYHDMGMYFAARGYPFLTVDVRGRGNSEGVFNPLINEGKDGFDIVEWIAKQPYCNGKVGMWGGSYAGFDQWATAGHLPPHLTTIAPAAAPYIGVEFPMRNNIPYPYLVQWLTLVWGHTSQDKLFWDNQAFWNARFRQWFDSGESFQSLDVRFGWPSKIFQEWVAHPTQGAHWTRYNPTAHQYAKMSMPILSITGAYDDDQPGALAHYFAHLRNASPFAQAQHYLVIGPWDHAGTRAPQREFLGLKVGPESMVDLPKLHLDWYTWTMDGGPKPEFLRKRVAYYVMVAERWRYVDSLEAATATVVPLYLQSTSNPADIFHSGTLSSVTSSESKRDYYVYDPKDTADSELESTIHPESQVDQRMVYARVGKQLIYHTAPFSADTEIGGFFTLAAWISIDQPDTDIRVWIYDIDLDGSSTLLTTDQIRARYRENLREERLVTTQKPLRYDFKSFLFVARKIKKGNRLRLVIGPINSIYSQKNFNSGGVVAAETMKDARPVNVGIFHGGEYTSVLHVPYGQTDA